MQEWIPGPDTELYGYLAFWDADGREHSWMTKRKERQHPLGIGSGATQISVDAPEVAELSRRLLAAFGWRGLVGVEWKRDERDRGFRLVEINPRTVIGNQLAISAGVDLPWIAYCELSDAAAAGGAGHHLPDRRPVGQRGPRPQGVPRPPAGRATDHRSVDALARPHPLVGPVVVARPGSLRHAVPRPGAPAPPRAALPDSVDPDAARECMTGELADFCEMGRVRRARSAFRPLDWGIGVPSALDR